MLFEARALVDEYGESAFEFGVRAFGVRVFGAFARL